FLSHGRKAGFSQLLAAQCASDRAQGSSHFHPDKKISPDGRDCDLRFCFSLCPSFSGLRKNFSRRSLTAAAIKPSEKSALSQRLTAAPPKVTLTTSFATTRVARWS